MNKHISNDGDFLLPWNNFNQRKLVHDGNGVCRTITGQGHCGNEPKVLVNCSPVNPMPDGTCRTIKEQYHKTSKANYERTGSMGATGVREVDNMGNELRIRKLTPKECFRLMGFDDADHDVLAENGISNTQIYKMAGNSIVVDVLEAIFTNLNEQYNLQDSM